ncbi:MAG: thiosulfate sulfurtransferase, partial [Deltaproteobacteria bacterium]|nr:thiosulfate sulfurtransferase [Deltaproteobacteria bacterium]
MDKGPETITTAKLQSELVDPDVKLIDVRPVEAYNGWKLAHESRGGHIKMARSLPFRWIDYIDWIEIVHSKGILPEHKLVVYGYDLEQTNKVVHLFKRAGYENIHA